MKITKDNIEEFNQAIKEKCRDKGIILIKKGEDVLEPVEVIKKE